MKHNIITFIFLFMGLLCLQLKGNAEENEKSWESIKDASVEVWNDAKDVGEDIADKTKQEGKSAWGKAKDGGEKVWDKTKETSKSVSSDLEDGSHSIWDDITDWWSDL